MIEMSYEHLAFEVTKTIGLHAFDEYLDKADNWKMTDEGIEVDKTSIKEEEELIKLKSPLEQTLIYEHCRCFGKSLRPGQHLRTEAMRIRLCKITDDLKNHYSYRPRSITLNMRSEAKKLIENLVH